MDIRVNDKIIGRSKGLEYYTQVPGKVRNRHSIVLVRGKECSRHLYRRYPSMRLIWNSIFETDMERYGMFHIFGETKNESGTLKVFDETNKWGIVRFWEKQKRMQRCNLFME